MPKTFLRPHSDQEQASPGPHHPRGIITSPAPVLPPGTPHGILDRLAEHLADATAQSSQMARLMARLEGPAVLETKTITIGALGVYEASHYKIPYASIAVINPGASPITLSSAAAQGSAPGGGQGQATVPGNTFASFNMAGSALSIYGPVGKTITYTVMTARIQPSAADLGPLPCVTAVGSFAAAGNGSATLPAGDAITGLDVTTGFPAAASTIVVTVTGAAGGTLTYQLSGSTTVAPALQRTFPAPIPPAAAGGQITVTVTGAASSAAGNIVAYGSAP